jgi:hypothetical protein
MLLGGEGEPYLLAALPCHMPLVIGERER